MKFGQREEIITVPEAAAILGISERTLGRLLAQGLIPYTRPSKHRRLKRSDVVNYQHQVTRLEGGGQILTGADVPNSPLRPRNPRR